MPRRWALSGWVRGKGPGRTPRGKVRGRDGKGDPQGDLFPFSSGFTFSPVQGSDRRLQDFPFLSSGSLKRSLFSSFLSWSVCNHTSSPSCLRRYFCLFYPSPETEAFSLFRASFPPSPLPATQRFPAVHSRRLRRCFFCVRSPPRPKMRATQSTDFMPKPKFPGFSDFMPSARRPLRAKARSCKARQKFSDKEISRFCGVFPQ